MIANWFKRNLTWNSSLDDFPDKSRDELYQLCLRKVCAEFIQTIPKLDWPKLLESLRNPSMEYKDACQESEVQTRPDH